MDAPTKDSVPSLPIYTISGLEEGCLPPAPPSYFNLPPASVHGAPPRYSCSDRPAGLIPPQGYQMYRYPHTRSSPCALTVLSNWRRRRIVYGGLMILVVVPLCILIIIICSIFITKH